jgi:type VI protein secretion system component VasA
MGWSVWLGKIQHLASADVCHLNEFLDIDRTRHLVHEFHWSGQRSKCDFQDSHTMDVWPSDATTRLAASRLVRAMTPVESVLEVNDSSSVANSADVQGFRQTDIRMVVHATTRLRFHAKGSQVRPSCMHPRSPALACNVVLTLEEQPPMEEGPDRERRSQPVHGVGLRMPESMLWIA